MNNMLVSSLDLLLASYIPGLKVEVGNPETPTGRGQEKSNKIPVYMQKDQKRGRLAKPKPFNITMLFLPNATEKPTVPPTYH